MGNEPDAHLNATKLRALLEFICRDIDGFNSARYVSGESIPYLA